MTDRTTTPMPDMPSTARVLVSTLTGVALAAGGFAIGAGATGIAGETTAFWYLSRTSGFVAYLLLWGSVVWGLLLSTGTGRLWARSPALLDVHQFLGSLGCGFAAFHGLILMGDRYIQFPLHAVLLPFAGTHEPLLVAGGQLGLWLSVLLILSFYARGRLGGRVWRNLHYASFAAYGMVLAHACLLGTESRTLWASFLYLSTAGAVVFLTLHRILTCGSLAPCLTRSCSPTTTS